MKNTVNDNAIGYLLNKVRLSSLSQKDEEKTIREILEYFRNERKGLMKSEIQERGLNIYHERGIKVKSLIETAENRNLIVRESREGIQITKEGEAFLRKFYTDNYSSDFMEFIEKITALFRDQGELELAPIQIEYLYWRGDYPVSKVEETYLKNPYNSEYEKEIVEFHEYLSGIKIENLKDDEYIFHFVPKLFLPSEWFHALSN